MLWCCCTYRLELRANKETFSLFRFCCCVQFNLDQWQITTITFALQKGDEKVDTQECNIESEWTRLTIDSKAC